MTAKKIKDGRPTIFDQSMIVGAKEYIAFFQLSEEAKAAQKDSRVNPTEVIPTVSGLALYLGVARSTVYEWKATNKDFSDILDSLMGVQEVLLLNNGLQGKFNAQISKLMLTKHDYSDKQEMDVKTNGESLNKPTIINLVGKTN